MYQTDMKMNVVKVSFPNGRCLGVFYPETGFLNTSRGTTDNVDEICEWIKDIRNMFPSAIFGMFQTENDDLSYIIKNNLEEIPMECDMFKP